MKIIFDGETLIGYSSKSPSRSGIFFCAFSILEEFGKKHEVIIYTDHKSWASIFFCQHFKKYKIIEPVNFFEKIVSYGYFIRSKLDPYRKFLPIKLLCKSLTLFVLFLGKIIFKDRKMDFSYADIFFSAHSCPIPSNINTQCFTLLHDAIPLVKPELCLESVRFFFKTQIVNCLSPQNHYFANSQYTKDDFLRLFPDKLCEEHIKVTYLGASQNFFYDFDTQKNIAIREKYKLPQDKKYIFSLCTLEPRKNLIFVINNFIQLLEERQIEDMIFVLGGGYRDSFISQIKQTAGKHQDQIIHIGYVDDEDLSNLFTHSLCSIYLSLYEGFGLPVLESMQCGCPVIASNTTSIPEIVEDSGILIDPQDSIALKKAILELYENPKLREYYRNKGLERAKHFSWEKCANEMLEYMQKVINQKGE